MDFFNTAEDFRQYCLALNLSHPKNFNFGTNFIKSTLLVIKIITLFFLRKPTTKQGKTASNKQSPKTTMLMVKL